MLRREERDGLWGIASWETPDPDEVEDVLNRTFVGKTDTLEAVLWQHLLIVDPEELRTHRERQKMNLARYGRQSLLQWENVEVLEIDRWHDRLKELIETENAITRGREEM